MNIKLDKIDRKIIYSLGINSRQAASEIARKFKISKEVANYRINNLVKNKVIQKYLAILNPPLLGIGLYKVCIKLQNISKEKKSELIKTLYDDDHISYLAECDGVFDIMFVFNARSYHDFDSYLTEFYNKYSYYINRKELGTNVYGKYYGRTYLLDKPIHEEETSYGKLMIAPKLDDKDWVILKCLCDNTRIECTEIAKNLKISADAIRKRIIALENSGIISGYSIVLNNPIIGQMHYKVFVELQDLSEKTLASIKEFARQSGRIIYVIKSLARWDLEIDIEVETAEQYREIMAKFSETFPNKIKSFESVIIYKIHEYTYLPKKFI